MVILLGMVFFLDARRIPWAMFLFRHRRPGLAHRTNFLYGSEHRV